MSIASMLNQTCSVYRNVTVGTNGRTQKQALHTNIACIAFPMSSTVALAHEFALGRAYDIFFDSGADIKVGDQIVIGSTTYDVRFIKAYAVTGVGHTLAMCEQEV